MFWNKKETIQESILVLLKVPATEALMPVIEAKLIELIKKL